MSRDDDDIKLFKTKLTNMEYYLKDYLFTLGIIFKLWENDRVRFCDIALFRKIPTTNDLGKDYFGTKRLKAPEENILGATIDELTSEFTLGAIIFDMFSNVENIDERYKKGMFIPNNIDTFELPKEVYDVLLKATSYDRKIRYSSIKEFCKAFMNAVKGSDKNG